MADATGTPTTDNTPTTPTADRSGDRQSATVQKFSGSVDKLGDILNKLSGATLGGIGTVNLESIKKLVSAGQTELNRLQGGINSVSTASLNRQFGSVGSSALNSFGGIPKALKSTLGFIEKQASTLGDMLGSAGIIGATQFQKAVVQKLGDATGYNIAQEHLMSIEKAAYQMGIAFNGSLEDARGGFNFFNRTLRESILTTRSFPQEILEVRKALGDTFGPNGVMSNLGIPQAASQIRSSLNLTNVALLAAKATGLDASRFTDLLTQSYLELGATAEEAALSIGVISGAAAQSGIGFDKTMKAIQSSADALKFWGGTINSVTPLFDMFSRSLAGTGRQGLTPQLLQSFTSGLERMSTAQRALLGIQGGMGGRGGAIGAALEMEEALEAGPAGMQKVVDNLTKTLGNFTGGKIITRQEAARDPTLQANFLAQRQLLQQLLGQDTATATKTLDALQGIQQTGLQTNSDQGQNLADLLGKGEQVGNETTTAIEKTSQLEIAAINSSAGNIIKAVEALTEKSGVTNIVRGSENALEKAAVTGQFNPSDMVRQVLSAMTGERDRIQAEIKERRSTGQKVPNELVQTLNNYGAQIKDLRATEKAIKAVPHQPSVRNALVERIPKEPIFAPKAEISPELKSMLTAKVSSGTATPQEIEILNNLNKSISDLKDLKIDMPPLQQGAPKDLKVDNTPLQRAADELKNKMPTVDIESIQRQVDNLIKQVPQNRELPLPPVQIKTETGKQIETPKTGTLLPRTSQKQQEEIIIKVVMDGESTIKLEPIVKQVVAKIYGNNHET